MFSHLTEKILDYISEFLELSMKVMQLDNHATQKYRMTAEVKSGKSLFSEPQPAFGGKKSGSTVDWVPVIGFAPIFTRDVSLSNESNRMHSSLINPPVCLVSFQVSPAYIQLLEEYGQGKNLYELKFEKVHQHGNAKTYDVESHIYKSVQILAMKVIFVGNIAIVSMCIQANALTIKQKKIKPDGSMNGSYEVEIQRTGMVKKD